MGGVGVGCSRRWARKGQQQGPGWGQRQGQRHGGLGCHGAPRTLSKRLWEVRRAVIRGVMIADFRKGLHGSSMEDEQREAGSESRVSRLETHAATQERSDESVNKVVCLYFGSKRVFKNLNSF